MFPCCPFDFITYFPSDYYYAQRTRAEQDGLAPAKLNVRELLLRKKAARDAADGNGAHDPVKDHTEVNFANRENRMEISDEEWTDASRAFRTASAGACFYLITTDILGPWGIGFSLGTLG